MQQLIVWASLQQFHNQTPGAGDCKGVKIVKEKTILGYLGPVVLLQTTSTTLLLGRRQSLPSQIKSVEAPEKKVFTAVIQLSLRNRNCVSQTLREALICETLQVSRTAVAFGTFGKWTVHHMFPPIFRSTQWTMNSFDRHATVQVVSDARPMAAGYWGAWGGDANACVQNSFWSLDREFKAYVGAYVRLRFQGFAYDTTTSKN